IEIQRKEEGMRKLVVLAAVAALALLGSSAAIGANQIGHDHFTSDPYADNWCGIDGTSVDRVVANYTADGSRVSLHIVTTFVATASGKSMEIIQSGVQKASQPVDNGDGTYSITFSSAGQSPLFRLPGGAQIHDNGLVIGVATFDAATDDFISFNIVKIAGARAAGCAAIVAAMS